MTRSDDLLKFFRKGLRAYASLCIPPPSPPPRLQPPLPRAPHGPTGKAMGPWHEGHNVCQKRIHRKQTKAVGGQ